MAKWRKIAVGMPPDWNTVGAEAKAPKEIVWCGNFSYADGELMVINGMMEDRIPYNNAPIYAETKYRLGRMQYISGGPGKLVLIVKPDEGVLASSFEQGEKVCCRVFLPATECLLYYPSFPRPAMRYHISKSILSACRIRDAPSLLPSTRTTQGPASLCDPKLLTRTQMYLNPEHSLHLQHVYARSGLMYPSVSDPSSPPHRTLRMRPRLDGCIAGRSQASKVQARDHSQGQSISPLSHTTPPTSKGPPVQSLALVRLLKSDIIVNPPADH